MKIRSKLIVILVVMSLLPVAVVAMIARSSAHRALKQHIGASSAKKGSPITAFESRPGFSIFLG